MTNVTVHTIQSAPAASRPLLEGIKRSGGWLRFSVLQMAANPP